MGQFIMQWHVVGERFSKRTAAGRLSGENVQEAKMMRYVASVALVAAALAGRAWALEPAAAQQERLEEIRTMIAEGKYAEAVEAARPFAASVKDKGVKAEATGLLATALRRNGDWALAAKAYKDLAGLVEKGSEAQIRAEATAEVLAASPGGVYPPLKKEGVAEEPRTLGHDDVVTDALALVGEARAKKLGAKASALKRSAAPADVVAALEEMAAGYREARVLAPQMGYEAEREAVRAAAERLESLSNEAMPKLREKLSALGQAAASQGGLNSGQQKEAQDYGDLCVKSGESEDKFREVMKDVGGAGWPERVKLGLASMGRNREYGVLALGFHRVTLMRRGLVR
jgi:hypothetical protein